MREADFSDSRKRDEPVVVQVADKCDAVKSPPGIELECRLRNEKTDGSRCDPDLERADSGHGNESGYVVEPVESWKSWSIPVRPRLLVAWLHFVIGSQSSMSDNPYPFHQRLQFLLRSTLRHRNVLYLSSQSHCRQHVLLQQHWMYRRSHFPGHEREVAVGVKKAKCGVQKSTKQMEATVDYLPFVCHPREKPIAKTWKRREYDRGSRFVFGE